MSDQRPRQPRFDIRLSAELRVNGKLVEGMTRNLSIGGVCVEIDRPIPEASQVAVTLFVVENDVETEGARNLTLNGTVQWAAEGDKSWSIGLKFDALTAVQTQALNLALKTVGGNN